MLRVYPVDRDVKPLNSTIKLEEVSKALETVTLDEEDDWEKMAERDQVEAVVVASNDPPKPKVPASFEDIDIPTTVLECYDFPPTARTSDLHDIFTDFTGYRVHWQTDTSALIVFSNATQAKSAYAKTLMNPFLKVRPFAGRPPNRNEPEGPRPVTTDKVARRLIAGALGMRVKKKTAEEEEADMKK
ncbi:hypothetical protein BC829DRAFT_382171 [Chytridium lagenaria]|nr:hypothetical protein BC829DRAFT_382171 [Chytridium lagenaria]